MKRVYIIAEGQSEQSFVNELLAPYLRKFEIHAVTPLLIQTSKTGRGGFVNYQHLKNTVSAKLKEECKHDIVVTSFVDFFRIPNDIPDYEASMTLSNRLDQVKSLEEAINKDIGDNRFFSYIQLHEFEALLFSNSHGFSYYMDEALAQHFNTIVAAYSNPEDINSSPQGAPSKRIIASYPYYNKVIEGTIIALEVGLPAMMDRCPRFNAWVQEIIRRATS